MVRGPFPWCSSMIWARCQSCNLNLFLSPFLHVICSKSHSTLQNWVRNVTLSRQAVHMPMAAGCCRGEGSAGGGGCPGRCGRSRDPHRRSQESCAEGGWMTSPRALHDLPSKENTPRSYFPATQRMFRWVRTRPWLTRITREAFSALLWYHGDHTCPRGGTFMGAVGAKSVYSEPGVNTELLRHKQ